MKQILITGSQGFIGRNLKTALEKGPYSVHEFEGDVTKAADIDSNLKKFTSLDLIFHFAGISSPAKCDEDKATALQVNTTSAGQFASAVSQRFSGCTFVFPSTGQVYASSESPSVLLSEKSPLGPINYYAETKLQAENLLRTLSSESQLNAVVLRLFNHTHKSQDPNFFLPSLYQQILSGTKNIKTGNLDLVRDFGAVQDLLAALQILAEKPLPMGFHIYNLSSGTGKKLKDLAQELASQLNKNVEWLVDEKLIRKGEPLSQIGSSDLFQKDTGWKPTHAHNEKDLICSFLSDL